MLIFIDFDGVLHPLTREEPDFCRLHLLWKILRACPHVNIVFSSSWREIYQLEEMVKFVTYGGGEDLADRVIGKTPILGGARCDRRDLEIQSWLNTNGYKCQWLAIDDMPKLFNGGHPNLYVVDGSRGLTEADVDAIIIRLLAARINIYGTPRGTKSSNEVILEGMIDQMDKSIARASAAIDEASEFVEASNKRIAAMELGKNSHRLNK